MSELESLREQIQQLTEENRELKSELAWRKGKYSVLEQYARNIRYVAAEHPGKLAIAIFSCVKELPFDPFDYALGVNNRPLPDDEEHNAQKQLNEGEDWFGRFVGYYCSLDSHLLDLYKTKVDDSGTPLAPANQKTLTGILCDQKSPVFNEVYQTKKLYRVFLNRQQYGLDLVVKVFPVLGEDHKIIGMISFTHDLTVHMEQRSIVSNGLVKIQNSTAVLSEEIEKVQQVLAEAKEFSKDVHEQDMEVEELTNGVNSMEFSLLSSIRIVKQLSLNASIEAIGAGKFGKGFQIIASEIKGLTEEMTSTVKRLDTIVDKINEMKRANTQKMTQINTMINHISKIADSLENEGRNYQQLVEDISKAETSYNEYLKTMIG